MSLAIEEIAQQAQHLWARGGARTLPLRVAVDTENDPLAMIHRIPGTADPKKRYGLAVGTHDVAKHSSSARCLISPHHPLVGVFIECRSAPGMSFSTHNGHRKRVKRSNKSDLKFETLNGLSHSLRSYRALHITRRKGDFCGIDFD